MSLVQRCTAETFTCPISVFSHISAFLPLLFALPSSFHSFLPQLVVIVAVVTHLQHIYNSHSFIQSYSSLPLQPFGLFQISVIEPFSGQVPAKSHHIYQPSHQLDITIKMRFSVATVLAIATAVFAQTDGFDVISNPYAGEKVLAGLPCEIQWAPSSQYQGTVRIDVLGGTTPQTLNKVGTIACE